MALISLSVCTAPRGALGYPPCSDVAGTGAGCDPCSSSKMVVNPLYRKRVSMTGAAIRRGGAVGAESIAIGSVLVVQEGSVLRIVLEEVEERRAAARWLFECFGHWHLNA